MTFCLVTLAWVFFRAGSMGEALGVFRGIAGVPSEIARLVPSGPVAEWKMHFKEVFALTDPEFGFLKGMALTILMLAVFISVSLLTRKRPGLEIIRERPIALRFAMYFALIIAIDCLSMSGYSGNFIYQRF